MVIQLSPSVMFSQLQYNRTNQLLGEDYSRMSSGLRIEKSADDPSDFAISNHLRAEGKLLRQSRRNAFDGLGFIQVTEGLLDTATNLLTRAAELATQAASGIVGAEGKAALDGEYQEILAELDRLNTQSEYNDFQIFGPAGQSIHIQFGDTSNESVTLSTQPIDTNALNLNGSDLLNGANALTVLEQVSVSINYISEQRSLLGAKSNRLQNTLESIDQRILDTQTAESQLRDADMAMEIIKMTTDQMHQDGAKAALAQANLSAGRVLSLFA